MSLKEQLQQKIEQLDDATLMQLAQTLEKLEAEKKQKDIEEKIALWEPLAEPDDSIDWTEFDEATKRRSLFGGQPS
ncbi:MAG: hypothetical protein ACRCYY_13825 [Trueperaceae bacterium]